MNVTTLKSRLYDLIQPILGGRVIWADQSAPRPALPYVTLRLGVITTIGEAHYSDVDNAGIQSVLGVRESMLNVVRFGADSVGAMEDFADKLALNSNLDKFSNQEVSLFDVSPVTDIAQLLNGIAIEPRASVDVSIRWASTQLDNVGIIQTVQGNGTIGPDGTALGDEYAINAVTVGY